MSIGVEIRTKIVECRREYRTPVRIYLGKFQYQALRVLGNEMGHLFLSNNEKDRLEFMGLPVFIVDADEHLHVASSAMMPRVSA